MKKQYSLWIAVGINCIFLFWGYNYWLKQQQKENRSKDCNKNISIKAQPWEPLEMAVYIPPEDWTKYLVGDDFYICVPPTIELRKSDDLYTQEISNSSWSGYAINTSNPVFQQKGLAVKDSTALQTYCRIILDIQRGEPGDFLKSSEYVDLTMEQIHAFQENARASILDPEFRNISQPIVRWIRIGDLYGIRIEYVRKGYENFYTYVCHYHFFNYDKITHITLSYRQNESYKWEKDFNNVIKTFKWKI